VHERIDPPRLRERPLNRIARAALGDQIRLDREEPARFRLDFHRTSDAHHGKAVREQIHHERLPEPSARSRHQHDAFSAFDPGLKRSQKTGTDTRPFERDASPRNAGSTESTPITLTENSALPAARPKRASCTTTARRQLDAARRTGRASCGPAIPRTRTL